MNNLYLKYLKYKKKYLKLKGGTQTLETHSYEYHQENNTPTFVISVLISLPGNNSKQIIDILNVERQNIDVEFLFKMTGRYFFFSENHNILKKILEIFHDFDLNFNDEENSLRFIHNLFVVYPRPYPVILAGLNILLDYGKFDFDVISIYEGGSEHTTDSLIDDLEITQEQKTELKTLIANSKISLK
jgi:hypothetical protein